MKYLLLTVIMLLGYGAGAYAAMDLPATTDDNTENDAATNLPATTDDNTENGADTDSPDTADNNTEHGFICTSGDLVKRTNLFFSLKVGVERVPAREEIYGDNYGKYVVLSPNRFGRVVVKLKRRRRFELHTLRLRLEDVNRITIKRNTRDAYGGYSVPHSYNTIGKDKLEMKWDDHKILEKFVVVAETEGNNASMTFSAIEACMLES